MSTIPPGGPSWPEPQRTDADLAIDASTSPAVLASLAEDRPAVRHLVAMNPSAPVHILMWLHELRDPVIDRALLANPTATAANVVRPSSTASVLGAATAGDVEPVAVGAAPAASAGPATALVEDHAARRWATWAILLVPLLAMLGISVLVWLVRDSGSSSRRPTAGASSVTPTLAPATLK